MKNLPVPVSKRRIPTISLRIKNFLPDNKDWKNRFEINSETSYEGKGKKYTIAQHKEKGHMGCSCMGWKRYRHCKHLDSLGLPGYEEPVNLEPYIQGEKFGI